MENLYYMTTASFVPTNEDDDFYIYGESIDANGNPSGANPFDETISGGGDTEFNAGTPFYDARAATR